MVCRPMQFKNLSDRGGRELETCYEKMRRWLTVGCQLGCLATTNGFTVTHRFLSLSVCVCFSSSSSSPPLLHLLPSCAQSREVEKKAEAPLASTIPVSNFHAVIFIIIIIIIFPSRLTNIAQVSLMFFFFFFFMVLRGRRVKRCRWKCSNACWVQQF